MLNCLVVVHSIICVGLKPQNSSLRTTTAPGAHPSVEVSELRPRNFPPFPPPPIGATDALCFRVFVRECVRPCFRHAFCWHDIQPNGRNVTTLRYSSGDRLGFESRGVKVKVRVTAGGGIHIDVWASSKFDNFKAKI